MADQQARIVISGVDKTRAAFDSAQKNIKGLTSGVAGLTSAFGPVGAAVASVSAILGAISLKGVINTADDLGKLSQRTGVTIENLSALRYAGDLAGISVDELGGALKKLNLNVAAAARGEKEQADAFKAIGIEVKNLDGTVRSADDVLGDIADKFSGYADGANKVALANALGGKSFEALIPLLNGGRKGIADARTELEKYGGVYDKDLADKAEKFNDSITKLGYAFEGLKVGVLQSIVGDLADLAGQFVIATQKGDLFNETLSKMSDFRFFTGGKSFLGNTLSELDLANKELERLKSLRERTAATPVPSILSGLVGPGIKSSVAALDKQIEAQQSKVDLLSPTKAPARSPAEARNQNLPEAPGLPDPEARARAAKAAADALAAANKISEARIKAIRDGLSTERDLYQFNEQALRITYGDGLISLRAFYDQREALRVKDLQAQKQAVDDEIAELERQRTAAVRGKRPQDVAEIDGKIQEARARASAAERESDQARSVAVRDQQRDVVELADRYAELNAQIAALGGNTAPQELLDISRKVKEARALLTQRGQDNGEANALQAALERQRQLGEVSKQSYEQSNAAANAETRLMLESQRTGRGLLETEQAIRAGREKSLAQLDAIIASTKNLADAGTPGAAQQLDDLVTQRAQLASQVDPTKLRFDAAAEEGAASIADSFRAAVLEGKSLASVIGDLDKRLTALVFDEVVTKPLTQGIAGILKGSGGQGVGENVLSFLGFGGSPVKGGSASTGAGQGFAQSVMSFFGLGGGALSESVAGSAVQTSGTAASAAAEIAASTAIASASASSALALSGLTVAATSAAAALAAVSGGSALSAAGGAFDLGASSFLDFGGSFATSFFHGGGLVGGLGGAQRQVSARAFDSATRYHSGGIAGLAADEVPAVLRRDEEVLTASDPRHRNNGGGAGRQNINYSPTFVLQAPADRRTQDQLAARALSGAQRAFAKNG